jgi:hypothetical protein
MEDINHLKSFSFGKEEVPKRIENQEITALPLKLPVSPQGLPVPPPPPALPPL